MTHAYAIRRLLEHGPLTFAELVEIVGCDAAVLTETLARMAGRREVERFFVPGCHRFVYRNTDVMPDLRPMGRPGHAARGAKAAPGRVRAGSAMGVPAAARGLSEVHASASGDRRGAGAVGRKG